MDDKDDPVDVYIGTSWQAGQVRELLENAGIGAFLKDEAMGYLDAPAISPGAIGSVKVVVARADIARAEALIQDFGGQNGLLDPNVPDATGPPVVSSWSCQGCGEQVEAQFGVCWKCGAPRP
jgi:hypothetical protein